jgi:hypothetical protein
MPIPSSEKATVPREKIVDYLLNVEHPVGGSKANWFIGLGYDPADPDVLIHDLIGVAQSCEDFVEQQAPHGIKYVALGRIVSPTQVYADVMTVWILEPEAGGPRLVTAYPARKSSDERA